jgi:hypothetical protein
MNVARAAPEAKENEMADQNEPAITSLNLWKAASMVRDHARRNGMPAAASASLPEIMEVMRESMHRGRLRELMLRERVEAAVQELDPAMDPVEARKLAEQVAREVVRENPR